MAGTQVLFEGTHLRLLRRGHWEYVERKGSRGIVVLVAVTTDGRLLLVEQYRPPLQARVIELPAGLVGDLSGSEDESGETAAGRELQEETGYRAARLRQLVESPISAGLSTEVASVFLATGAEPVGPGGGDETEDIAVHAVPLEDATQWLEDASRRGAAVDAKVYAGLYFAEKYAR